MRRTAARLPLTSSLASPSTCTARSNTTRSRGEIAGARKRVGSYSRGATVFVGSPTACAGVASLRQKGGCRLDGEAGAG
eukprot:3570734-Pleurochrysis_carterae.AAC.1